MEANGGGVMYVLVWRSGEVMIREAEEESSLCVERSEGWGCTCVGRRCGEVGRVLFKKG